MANNRPGVVVAREVGGRVGEGAFGFSFFKIILSSRVDVDDPTEKNRKYQIRR